MTDKATKANQENNAPVAQDENKLIAERRVKLEKIRSNCSANGFPNDFNREHLAADIQAQHGEKTKEELAGSVAREQAAIKQSQEVIEAFEKEQEHHGQTKEHIQEFVEDKEEIQEIQEEADEKTQDIINSDIAGKLKFMQNVSTSSSEN